MEWIEFGFNLDLIWIVIGVLKFFKECARSPCNWNHFLSSGLLRVNQKRKVLEVCAMLNIEF